MNNREISEQLIAARKEYINLIKSEVLGPGSEFSVPDAKHELISSSPLSRYSVGILYPQGNLVNQDSEETVPINESEDVSDESIEADAEELPATLGEATEQPCASSRNYEFDETADENLDEEIGLSSQYMPSSMGMTFLVKGNMTTVRGDVLFATYRNAKIPDCVVPYTPDNPGTYIIPPELAHFMSYDKELKVLRLMSPVKKKDIRDIFEKDKIPNNEQFFLKQAAYRFVDFYRNGYVRIPHKLIFNLDFSHSDYFDEKREIDGTIVKVTALRTKISDKIWSVTIMLVNNITETPVKARYCIFQPVLRISTNKNSFKFIENNPNPDFSAMDDEERSLELLYRKKKIYATGLGVSVDWNIDDTGNGSVWSDFFPEAEVPPMSFDLPENNSVLEADLSMKRLSDLDNSDKSQKISSLTVLVDLYKTWTDDLEDAARCLDACYQPAAEKNIAECKRTYERMYAGIETLRKSEIAYSAFLLANRAMFMQRVHLRMQQQTSDMNRYPGDELISELLLNMDYRQEDDDDCKWRPFQIAFLLMDINSVVYDDAPERNIVDLIWFPTGGGKTEAYLGLTAFTIFYRKLAHHTESGGTTVIMRYTLRLLAAQQFTRDRKSVV